MADKREAQKNLKRLQYLKTWQLVLVFLLFAFIAATFMRLNNVGMAQRREAVIQADKAGDKEVIKARVFELQRFVTSHMNANMGVVYLENQYRRDSQAAIDAASGVSNPNGNIYKKAQDECAPKFSHYSQAYLQCTVDFLNKYSPAEQKAVSPDLLPKVDLYRYSFVSPLWAPDFAGMFVLIAVFILFVIIARITGVIILKSIIKARNNHS